MKTILLFSCIALTPFPALAQTFPIPRIGSCPLGYYNAGSYCQPSVGNPRKWSVPANNSSACPLGTYRNGNYCTKSYGSSY